MNRFEFYKSLYEIEDKKWTELHNSLNIPLAVIAIIGAAIYTYIINFHYCEFNFNTWVFILLCSMSGILLIISIIYLIKVFVFSFQTDYNYRHIGYTDELEEFYMTILNRYPNTNSDRVVMATLDYENFLIERYALFSGANLRINKAWSAYLNRGKVFLVSSLVFVIIAFIPFLVNRFYHIPLI